MNEFSAVSVATSGFQLMRSRPGTVAAWIGAQFLLIVVCGVLVVAVLAPVFAPLAGAFMETMNLNSGAEDRLGQLVLARLPLLIGLYLVILVLALVVTTVFNCAILRAVLRPEESGAAYLRLGGDEMRVLGAQLVYALMYLAGFGVVGFAVFMLAIAVGSMAWLVYFLAIVGGIVGAIFLAVRLSLAMVQTFFEGRIQLFGSWTLTAGRFWPLLGAYLLTFVFMIVISIVGSVITQIFGAAFAGSAASSMAGLSSGQTPDVSALLGVLAPLFVISIIISAITNAIGNVLMVSATASAYRAVSPAFVSEVF